MSAASASARSQVASLSIMAPPTGPIVGIDVGEDFLDLAVLDATAKDLRLARVAVTAVERAGLAQADIARGCIAQRAIANDGGAIRELERRLIAAAPELGVPGAIVLIDSPRWPRDLNVAMRTDDVDARPRSEHRGAGRAIDACLRAIVSKLALRKRDGSPFRLALFPTPKFDYFAACARDAGCKPHLAAIARELFGAALQTAPTLSAPAGGRVFTRFMLTGFAAYRALEARPGQCFEAYPDLAFRLWARRAQIPSKSAGRAALAARQRINRRLAEALGCVGAGNIATLDEADAAVLALSAGLAARAGVIAVIEERGEGRFALALDRDQARRLNQCQLKAT